MPGERSPRITTDPSPLVTELVRPPEPAAACARLRDLPYCLLLESAARSPGLGRYSFLCADPFLVIRGRDGRVEARGADGATLRGDDPFALLRAVLAAHPAETIPGLPPFQGGAAGFFAYDLCRGLERVPPHRHDDLGLPDLCVGLYDVVLAWDHLAGRCWVVSTGLPAAPGAERRDLARLRAARLLERLAAPPAPAAGRRSSVVGPPTADSREPTTPELHPVPDAPGVLSTFSRPAYLEMVESTREYIRAGDIFQANVSQRLEAPLARSPLALYRSLRRRNPAPFAAYFDLGEAVLLSSSPERFLRLSAGRVETRPIKGTAPRGATPAEDRALARALAESEKDRAENVMIVDLLRNDLSLVCRDRSVRVPELCVVESHATVHHLVSAVTGELRPGLGAVDLLRAAFPGGSITGAPKVRAMEIIAELEPTRRGPYTGAIGYIGFDGTMDTNIAIRTLVARGERAYFQVGGGIVIGSDPAREYQETLHKARGMLDALAAAHAAREPVSP